jgi:hypothetical protein
MNRALFRFLLVPVLIVGVGCSQPAEKPTSKAISSAKQDSAAQLTASESTDEFELQAPISFVEAGEWWDGGTVYFHLRDSLGKEAHLCVYQAAFENVIPSNSIFIGAIHPDSVSARLPRSAAEVERILAALKSAAEPLATDELRELSQYDPLELHTAESASKAPAGTAVVVLGAEPRPEVTDGKQHTEEQWDTVYALHAIRRLESVENPTIVTDDPGTVPSWFAEYDKKRKEIAEYRAREDQKIDEFKSFFPEKSQKLLDGTMGDLNDPWKPIEDRGNQLVESLGGPVELFITASRAFGTTSDWRSFDTMQMVVLEAIKEIDGQSVEKALTQLQNDRQALLGAARLYLYEELNKKVAGDARDNWITQLAEVVLADGVSPDKTFVLNFLSDEKSSSSLDFLRKVADGSIGKQTVEDSDDENKCEPGIQAHAYVALAIRGDESVRPQIERRLADADGCDQMAYETSLAMLGDTSYLKREHFQIESAVIPFAALRAVRNAKGKSGLNFVVEDALGHEWGAVRDEAVLTIQDCTGKVWAVDKNRDPSVYSDDVLLWWKSDEALPFRYKEVAP